MVICLERDADCLHNYGPADATAIPKPHHLLPRFPLCFTFLVPAYPGCLGKEVLKWV